MKQREIFNRGFNYQILYLHCCCCLKESYNGNKMASEMLRSSRPFVTGSVHVQRPLGQILMLERLSSLNGSHTAWAHTGSLCILPEDGESLFYTKFYKGMEKLLPHLSISKKRTCKPPASNSSEIISENFVFNYFLTCLEAEEIATEDFSSP